MRSLCKGRCSTPAAPAAPGAGGHPAWRCCGPRAETLREPKLGLVREGFLADLVLVDGNPAENFRHLYAFGAIRMGDDGEMYRSRGIVHPIKDGVVIENARLMEEVARMVEESRIDTGSYITETPFRTGGTP